MPLAIHQSCPSCCQPAGSTCGEQGQYTRRSGTAPSELSHSQRMASPRSSMMVANAAPFQELPPCSFSASPKAAGTRLDQSAASRRGAQRAPQPCDQDAVKPGNAVIRQVRSPPWVM